MCRRQRGENQADSMSGARSVKKRLDTDELLTPPEAIEMLAQRAIKNGEVISTVQERWRKRIEAARERGDLARIDGKYRCVDLAEWARGLRRAVPSDWLSRLKDLPLPPPSGEAKIEFRASGEGLVIPALPQTLEEAHARIIHLHGLIESKQQEIDELKPDADRYRANCAKNTNNARRKRKLAEEKN